MFTAIFLYEQCYATVNENIWLNKRSETGLFLENPIVFSGLLADTQSVVQGLQGAPYAFHETK